MECFFSHGGDPTLYLYKDYKGAKVVSRGNVSPGMIDGLYTAFLNDKILFSINTMLYTTDGEYIMFLGETPDKD